MRSGGDSGRGGAGVMAALAVNVPVAALLAVSAWWRETPVFWRNEGQQPLWLRDWVLVGFPLLLGAEVFFLIWLTLALVRAGRGGEGGARWVAGGVVLQWVWLGLVMAILLWNNVANLLEGRPVHWKPQ